jgi:hypothetical protein
LENRRRHCKWQKEWNERINGRIELAKYKLDKLLDELWKFQTFTKHRYDVYPHNQEYKQAREKFAPDDELTQLEQLIDVASCVIEVSRRLRETQRAYDALDNQWSELMNNLENVKRLPMITNIAELRQELVRIFHQLRERRISVSVANAHARLAEGIVSTLKVELYHGAVLRRREAEEAEAAGEAGEAHDVDVEAAPARPAEKWVEFVEGEEG